jgi:hypothetical protein
VSVSVRSCWPGLVPLVKGSLCRGRRRRTKARQHTYITAMTTTQQALHPANTVRTIEYRNPINTFGFRSQSLGRKVRVKDLTYLSDAKLRALMLESDSLLDHFSQQEGRARWLIDQVAAFVAAVAAEITYRSEHRDLFRKLVAAEIGEEALMAIDERVRVIARATAAASGNPPGAPAGGDGRGPHRAAQGLEEGHLPGPDPRLGHHQSGVRCLGSILCQEGRSVAPAPPLPA